MRPNRARTDTHGRGRASGRAVLAIALPYASYPAVPRGGAEAKDCPVAQIFDYLQQPGTVVWFDLCEPDRADLEVISQEFGLHPLAVEDATQQHERPKLDRYQDHYFLTAYAVSLDPATGRLTTSEVAAFITPRALITVRKDPSFDIDEVVARWDGSADLAGHGVGFLL